MSAIDDYLKPLEPSVRNELNRIRAVAKNLLPGCEETISYRMPTLKYKGKSILGFDSHTNHIGIYPFSGSVISKIKELDEYSGTKSAVHEKLDQPLPDALIEKLVRERLKQAGI
jgi:uncharacterized protein YdhG (YjbR/CyaY superfamily)